MASTTDPTALSRSLSRGDFAPEEFRGRWGRIFDAIGDGAHAVLQAAPPVRGFEVFRQSNEFYYACGVQVPQAFLLLDGSARRATLYLPSGELGFSGDGADPPAEQAELARRLTGVDAVCRPDALADHLKAVSVLYTPHCPAEGRFATRHGGRVANRDIAADCWDGQPAREHRFIALLKSRYPQMDVRDLSPILDEMRSLKSPAEIELLRRAGELTAQAVTQAMGVTRPGLLERHLAAIADYIYLLGGAQGEAYRAIIAGGPNIQDAHYYWNDCLLKDGDMLLMDVAPDYRHYTSDIGRMWPVNGTYSPVQRELYGYIVEYHKCLLRRIRPGATADAIMDECAAEMAKVVEATSFSKSIYEQAARRTLEFRGHLSHPVGMAVHDVGGYRGKPLGAGVVLSVDPQMWIPEEKLYLRAEDTLAITDDGVENLTGAAPLELDEVEALMRKPPPPLPLP